MQPYHPDQQDDSHNNNEQDDDSDWLNSDNEEEEKRQINNINEEEANSSTIPSMTERETQKVERKLYDEGYREGIGLGKESAIQKGFDDGFPLGSPIGKKLGNLIGSLTSLESILPQSHSLFLKVFKLKEQITTLRLSDLIEPDWEAIEHERSHGGQVDHIKPESEEERIKRESILAGYQKEVNDLIDEVLSM